MKDRLLIYLSLTLSVVALFYAAWVHQNAAQMAEQAIQKRERQFVQALAPKVREAYKGLGLTNSVSNPTTLDELFGPFVEMFNRINSPPSEDNRKTP